MASNPPSPQLERVGESPRPGFEHSGVERGFGPWAVFASLLAVGLPPLSLDWSEFGGPSVVNLAIVGLAVFRSVQYQRVLVHSLSPESVFGLALALIIIGIAVTTIVVPAPFYSLDSWRAVAHGLVIAGSAVVVFAGLRATRVVETLIVSACAVGYLWLVGLPLLIDPGAVVNLAEALGSGSAAAIVNQGYRPLFEAIDAHPWLSLPVAERSANLRHDAALVLVLALAPLPPTVRLTGIVRAARLAALFGVVVSLSPSAIGAAIIVGLVNLTSSLRQERWRRSQGAVPMLVGLGFVGAIALSQFGSSFVERLSGQHDASASDRVAGLERGIDRFGRSLVGQSIDDLGPEVIRPHVYLFDAYIGAGVLGLISSLLILVAFTTAAWRAGTAVSAGSTSPLHGIILAVSVVALVRYLTAGSFLDSSIAWYAGGAILGCQQHLRLARPGSG